MDAEQEGINELAGWLSETGSQFWQSSSDNPSLTQDLIRRIVSDRNVQLQEETVRQHRTPYALAAWMYEHADAIYDPLIELAHSKGQSSDGDRPVIVCIHALSGYGRAFRRLGQELTQFGDVWSIQARGLNPGETPFASFDALQRCYCDRILEVAQGRKVYTVGFSFGGAAAHAISIELSARNHPVGTVFVLDTILFDEESDLPTFDDFLSMVYRETDPTLSEEDWAAFQSTNSDDRLNLFFKNLVLSDTSTPSRSQTDTTGFFAKAMSQAAMKRAGRVSYELHRVLRSFKPDHFAGRTVLVRSTDAKKWRPPFVLWQPSSEELYVENLTCLHVRMLHKPMALKRIAELFRQYG